MKVVFLSPTFTPKMSGYAGMALPKAMAQLGAEVHVISGNLNVYHQLPDYKQIYEPFIGPAVTSCGVEMHENYTLHRLPHSSLLGQIRLKGLARKLRSILPDIVHSWTNISFIALETALWSKFFGYKFFTAQHNSKSTFSLATQNEIHLSEKIKNFFLRYLQGRFISKFTEKCYLPTPDCQEIAIKFMGVPDKKCVLRPLGVDNQLFHPVENQKEEDRRTELRSSFGFKADDIVCIYTGRFSQGKNPLCLAKAISKLNAGGKPFKALFIGNGPQSEALSFYESCVVHPFVDYIDLPQYYQIADIAVYPVEYTTSMLEAAACGLPLIISNRIQAKERIEGNGLTYSENDPEDLMNILKNFEDANLRYRLGQVGTAKMRQQFSWMAVARRTLLDFEQALKYK